MSDPKQARAWVRRNARPCPCCGQPLVIEVDGDGKARDYVQSLKDRGAKVRLVPAEEAEAAISAAPGFKEIRPIGGRV